MAASLSPEGATGATLAKVMMLLPLGGIGVDMHVPRRKSAIRDDDVAVSIMDFSDRDEVRAAKDEGLALGARCQHIAQLGYLAGNGLDVRPQLRVRLDPVSPHPQNKPLAP